MQRVNEEATMAREPADRGVPLEPVREGGRVKDQLPDATDEAGERTLEEAGYGYGV